LQDSSSSELSEFAYYKDEKEVLLDRTPLTRLSAIMINASTQGLFRLLVPRDLPLNSVTEVLITVLGLPAVSADSFSWYCRTTDRSLLKMNRAAASSPRTVADFVGVDPVQMELVFSIFHVEGGRIKPMLPFERAPLSADVFKVKTKIHISL
jgi:hypothetical protein